MSNIRLFFPKSLSINLLDKLDKSQSHYVSKVMRTKENEVFSLHFSAAELTSNNVPYASKIIALIFFIN